MLLDSFLRYLDSHGPRTRAKGSRRRAAHAQLFLERFEERALPSFLAPLSFDVETAPESVAVADVNGDGRPDLAAASRFSDSVSVLLGNGDGSFQAARHFATGQRPTSVAVGDFNRDTRPDLAVANGGSGVSVLLGNGDGTFQAARNFDAGGGPLSVAVGHFNADALPDLAVANTSTGNVSVLLGNGDGTFQAARNFAAGSFPQSVAVGDFNGDARLDLALAGYFIDEDGPVDANVRVLLGNGDGTFQVARTFAAGNLPNYVAVADVNGDGRPDLAVANNTSSGTVSVLLGNGDGTFQVPRTFAAGTGPSSVAVADVNGDGRPDLAVANVGFSTSGNVSVLLGNGDGTFQAARNFAAGRSPSSVAAADVNGDGRPDLAVANRNSNNVSVLLGNGDGTFLAAPSFAAGNDSQSVAVADVNGDGRPDLAVTGPGCDFLGCYAPGTVRVLLGNGDGTFQAPRIFATGVGPNSVAVADFNRDGRPDLAVVGYGLQCDEGGCIPSDEFVSVLLGNGDGTFRAASGFSAGSEPGSVAVGDFNGDSRPDLAVANRNSNNVSVLLGNGDGTFQAPRNFAVGGAPNSVAVADLNGDGRPDLATANRSINTVSVLLGNGDGTFQTARNFQTGLGGGAVAVADVNGDGRPDLAVAGSGGVSVLLGNGDGTFQAARNFAAGLQPSSVAVGEFNGDGFLDIGVVSSGGVRVLLGNGDGTLQTTHVSYVAGAAPLSVAVGNFNGDGRADLAVAGGSGVSILLNNTLLAVTSLTPTATGFALQFNRSFDAGALNLYDTASAGLGPADVTLVGSTTGPITGSLLVQAGAHRITFVRTGGVLPPDTYTVTLRSAANGFRTPAGTLLDGNGDGTPGGNYITTFPVAASSAVVVSVPDFTRGPGQPVNVPADRPGLPLRLSNGSGVTAVSLTLAYNPALLRLTGAAVAAGLPPGATVALNTATAGQAILTFTSPMPLPAGPLDFVTLIASVPDNAPYAAKQVLNITNLTVNGVAARDDDGIHVVGYFGDTTGNAAYSAADATRVLRVAVGLDSGFDAFQLADPVLIADITGNGTINATDATRLLQETLGIDQPQIPPLPGVIPPFVPGGPDPFLNIPTDFTAAPGEVLTVPVLLDLSDGLESADLAISYDIGRLELLGIARGSLTGDFDLFAGNPDARDGTLRVGLGRSAGPIFSRGSGSVLEITFRVRADAPAGLAVINLRRSLGLVTTQLNEGGLDLIPDPSDEEGDVLDGLITVLGKSSKTLPVQGNGPRRHHEKPTTRMDLTDAVFAMLARRQRRDTILSDA